MEWVSGLVDALPEEGPKQVHHDHMRFEKLIGYPFRMFVTKVRLHGTRRK
jgi:hypothetical protein